MESTQSLVLGTEQQQKLCITPELRQGLRILEMPALEMCEYIHGCVLENPFLEYVDQKNHDSTVDEGLETNELSQESETAQYHSNSFISDGIPSDARSREFYDCPPIQNQNAGEHLEQQLDMELSDDTLKDVGRFLIGSLNSNGYLSISVDEAATILKTTPNQVLRALQALQACEPAGIAARDLKECLLIQIERKDEDYPVAKAIISSHLEDLAKHNFKHIAASLCVSLAEVRKAKERILMLDPRPGRQLPAEPTPTIYPEVLVVKRNGRYAADIQKSNIPRLQINQEYRTLTKQCDSNKATAQYLVENLKAAEGLIHGIARRAETVQKIASSIVDLQQEFFEEGVRFLKPLTMSQIAEMVDVHESTVSRVVNGNYMQTTNGVFEMRYFFHTGYQSRKGRVISSESVKFEIAEIVRTEDPSSPLSDISIQKKLEENNISISRRTVNKYRKSLRLDSASQRKRFDE